MTSTARLEEWEQKRYQYSIAAYVERLKKAERHRKYKFLTNVALGVLLFFGTIFS